MNIIDRAARLRWSRLMERTGGETATSLLPKGLVSALMAAVCLVLCHPRSPASRVHRGLPSRRSAGGRPGRKRSGVNPNNNRNGFLGEQTTNVGEQTCNKSK